MDQAGLNGGIIFKSHQSRSVMLYALCIQPEAFQVVKFAVLPAEDVNHNVDIIHQCPLFAAFCVVRFLFSLPLHGINYCISNGFYLYIALRLAENEKIGNCLIYLPQVKAYDGLAFFLFYGRDNGFKKLTGAARADGRLFACLKGCDNFLQMKYLKVVSVITLGLVVYQKYESFVAGKSGLA